MIPEKYWVTPSLQTICQSLLEEASYGFDNSVEDNLVYFTLNHQWLARCFDGCFVGGLATY